MVGSGIRRIGRYGAGACAALVALAIAPVAAQADPPNLTITAPSSGALTNERSTTFSGSTSDSLDSVTVDIYQGTGTGGARIREELAVPSGSEWSTKAQPLPDGTYTAVAQQGAAEVGFSEEVTFTVDATAPAVTLDAVAPATNTSAPNFKGSAGTTTGDAETVSVIVYSGAAVGGQQAAAGVTTVHSGGWSFTSPGLPDGTYTVQASQGDEAGNVGTSAAGTFRVDTTAPAPLSLNAIPAVLATATPSFGGGGGQEPGDGAVRVLLDGKVVGEAAVSSGSWALTSPQLSDGSHTVRAEQVDETGNVSTTSTASFRVDTSAPAPTITGPKSGEVLKSSLVEFRGNAGNATGDAAEVTVEVFKGESTAAENLEQSFTVSRSGSSWSSHNSLSQGAHTARVRQLDSAGNGGVSAAVTFGVDTVAPSLTLNAVPSVIANATTSFGGAAGQEPGDGAVRVLVDGSLIGEASVSAGSWTLNSPHLTDGTHTVRAEQTDQAGNVSTTSTATFRVDTIAPEPTITGPKAGEKLKSSLVEFRGNAGNATGDAAEVTVEVFKGESTAAENLEQSFTVSRSGSSWSSASSGPRLSNGLYTVRVEQLDSVGNKGVGEAVTFEVDSPAPSVTLNELPRFTADATPSFSGSADATAEAKPEVTVRVWRGTSASGSLAESASGPASAGAWSLGLAEPLADGTYTAQAEQPPVAKNQAGVSEATTFTVDTQAPQLTLSGPGESTGLETVSGSAGTAPGDRRQVTAELFSGGSAEGAAIETITVLDSTDGTWSATFAGLGGGQYTVVARQSDEAGNTGSSAAQSFTVSAPPPPTGPSAPVASFTWVPQTPTVGQSVSLVSKSTDASSAITGYGWDLAGSGPFAAGGPVMTTTFATAGAHTVRLQVIDANGLSSTVAEAIQVAPQTLTLMQPFPIVRIAGAETSGGARIKLLTVQAPTGAKVAVSCKGRGCKTKSETRLATASSKSKGKSRTGAITLAFPRFQRTLRAGAMLQIRITKSGQIGKFTSFKIRRRKLPVRVDACLRPPSTTPSPCPSQ